MANDFQKWLKSQGYSREFGTSGSWVKDGVAVSGKELLRKLNEYKASRK